jgi:hypothetical protein
MGSDLSAHVEPLGSVQESSQRRALQPLSVELNDESALIAALDLSWHLPIAPGKIAGMANQ